MIELPDAGAHDPKNRRRFLAELTAVDFWRLRAPLEASLADDAVLVQYEHTGITDAPLLVSSDESDALSHLPG